jgi:hypothetical protein
MTTIYRHMMFDNAVSLDLASKIQTDEMASEAALKGLTLNDITLVWNGTLAEAAQSEEASPLLGDLLSGGNSDSLNVVIHSATATKA